MFANRGKETGIDGAGIFVTFCKVTGGNLGGGEYADTFAAYIECITTEPSNITVKGTD